MHLNFTFAKMTYKNKFHSILLVSFYTILMYKLRPSLYNFLSKPDPKYTCVQIFENDIKGQCRTYGVARARVRGLGSFNK